LFLIGSPPAKKSKSPKKVTSETSAGSGAGYKSKEFISDNEASSSDSDDRPLVRKEEKKESDSEVGEVARFRSIFHCVVSVSIISASLSEHKHSCYGPVVQPICWSVCVSVCLEGILWQNG